MGDRPAPAQRVSAVRFPDRYGLPARPEDASSQARDAYRQTSFLLGADVRLFEEGMNLQLRILHGASHSSFRTHPYAALVGLWSRAHQALADGCLLATRGSYASCAPLARAACELIAAQHQLLAGEMEVFLEWLAGNFSPSEEHKAFEFGLGRYDAGETLAADERLRSIERPASELGRPNFGATALLVGPESNNRRLALTFADASFHLGWAEVVLGWLLALCERQLAVAVHSGGTFPIDEDLRRACADFARRVDVALAKADRCAIEEIREGRYVVRNFRRASGGAPKRVLL